MPIPYETFDSDDWIYPGRYPTGANGKILLRDWFEQNQHYLKYTREQICADAEPYKKHHPPECEGIYFLVQDQEIAYVGKSSDIRRRLKSHAVWKEFNRYWCFGGMPPEALDHLEGFYFQKLRPYLNAKSVGCGAEFMHDYLKAYP